MLTNKTAYPWAGLEFNIRFFGTNGSLIDSATGHETFVLQPHDEHSFTINLYGRRPRKGVVAHTVHVLAAKESNSW
jgi:hypothetical protein